MGSKTENSTGKAGKPAASETRTRRAAAPAKKDIVAAKSAPASPARARTTRAKAPAQKPPLSPDERHRLVAEAAYYIAEQRGFRGGAELDDWLQAEAQILSQYGTSLVQ